MKSTDKDKIAVGQRFRQIRLHLGLHQGLLADKLGCGRSNISLIEAGINLPGGKLLIQLREKFNVSLDWLFSGEGNMLITELKRANDLAEFLENTWEIKLMLTEMRNDREILHRVLADFFSHRGKKRRLEDLDDESVETK